MDDKAERVHRNPLFSPTLQSQEKCWDVHAESNKNTPKNSGGRSEKGAWLMEGMMKFNSNSPQSSAKARDSNSGGGRHCKQLSMVEDDKEREGLAALKMRVRKLMEEQEDIIYEKCWDLHEEIAESNKNTPKNLERRPEKCSCSMKGLKIFNSNAPQSSAKARDSSGRHWRQQSDKECEGLTELRMRVWKLMEEQEREDHELYGKEEKNSRSCSERPLIIQAGGRASDHPLYSSFTRRPRSLRYRCGPAAEFFIPKCRPEQFIADIQTTDEETKAEAERSDSESSICQGDARSEGIETNGRESHDPQLAQESHYLEEQRSKNTIEDAEQPQECAEPDDRMEPNSNSQIDYSINTSTVGFRSSRSVLCKMMLPLLMFLALATAYSGIGLLDTSYGSVKNVQDRKANMNALPLQARLSPSQKIEEFSYWLFGPAMHSEYMGPLKKSSSVAVGKFVDSVSLCSSSVFSYLKSCTECMSQEICGEFINFSRRFMGILMNFLYQDLPLSARAAAHEIQGLCKCFNSNKNVETMNTMESGMNNSASVEENQVSEKDTNQGIQENSSAEHIEFIQEPDNSITDAENHGYQEVHDQMVAEEQEDSTFSEVNVSASSLSSSPEVMEDQQVHLNPDPVVLQDSSNGPNTTLGLDHKSSGIILNFVTIVAATVALVILFLSIAGESKAQEMEGRKRTIKNQRKRQQIESERTMADESPALGSFIKYSNEGSSTPTAVRRSMRIRNRSISPLSTAPIFTTPNSAHSKS